jgi:hypothetical protein
MMVVCHSASSVYGENTTTKLDKYKSMTRANFVRLGNTKTNTDKPRAKVVYLENTTINRNEMQRLIAKYVERKNTKTNLHNHHANIVQLGKIL